MKNINYDYYNSLNKSDRCYIRAGLNIDAFITKLDEAEIPFSANITMGIVTVSKENDQRAHEILCSLIKERATNHNTEVKQITTIRKNAVKKPLYTTYYAERHIKKVMPCFVCQKHSFYGSCSKCFKLNGDCDYSTSTPDIIKRKNFICCRICRKNNSCTDKRG